MNPLVFIVSIANGDPDLLNAKTVKTLKECGQLVLRTSRTPLVSWLEKEKLNYFSLDFLYESAEDFDQLSSLIAEHIWSAAQRQPVVYAVSDLMSDSSVTAIFASKPDYGIVNVIPGVGLSDVYHSSARSLMSVSDLRTVSATCFLSVDFDPNTFLMITELDNQILAGEVKIRLSSCLEDESEVFYMHDHDHPVCIPLYELDRQENIDHLSAVLVPGSGYLDRNDFVLNDLLHIMDRLRAPDGCPWDRIQTHQSLRPFLIEEAWECIAAIEQNNPDHLAEELGDLLFQIVFHASIGKSFDEFCMKNVIDSVCHKMINRHPHVFSDPFSRTVSAPSAAEWEKIKRSETGCSSVLESLDDVSSSLPALEYALKILKKLSAFPAFHRKTEDIVTDIRCLIDVESNKGNVPDELFSGRLLYLCAELCFSLNYDGELLLHDTVKKLKKRIQGSEKQIQRDGKSFECLTFEELSVYLNQVEDEIE